MLHPVPFEWGLQKLSNGAVNTIKNIPRAVASEREMIDMRPNVAFDMFLFRISAWTRPAVLLKEAAPFTVMFGLYCEL